MKVNSSQKVLIVFGTRPEAIKLAPLILKFKEHPEFDVEVCVTAQHREMLDQVLNFFKIIPDYDLNLMRENQSLFELTSSCLMEMENVLNKVKPDYVFVQGDTTTAFAASLSAFYQKLPVCHVEAGLRTNNIYSPFPEEINRQLISRICSFHFAPTETAQKNLLQENIKNSSILVTGNTVIDALLEAKARINDNSEKIKELKSKINYEASQRLRRILVTAHRRESHDGGIENLCLALRDIAEQYPDIQIVFPVHFNPNVRKPVNDLLSNIPNIVLMDPLEYEPFVWLIGKSYLIVTDSGGIQEEAPSLGKPVLVVRDNTERSEAVEAGTVKLVGTNQDSIMSNIMLLLDDNKEYLTMNKAVNPYGDGNACKRITDFMLRLFDQS